MTDLYDKEVSTQELQVSLGKIRHHVSSKLPNQKAPAQLLAAIESTLADDRQASTSKDARTPSGPSEYYLSLEATLTRATESSLGNNESVVSSSVYLLTLVAPHVSPGVLQSRVNHIIQPLGGILAQTNDSSSTSASEGQAALLRSTIGVLEPLFVALRSNRATLDRNLHLRGCWNSILGLSMDARPKVRRRAHELVSNVLKPDGEKAHPYAVKTAEWAVSTLGDIGVSSSASKIQAPVFDKKAGRAKEPEVAAAARQRQADGGANSGIWVCTLLKQLAPILPSKSIPSLSSALIRLVGQQNPFLSAAAFEVFESLFRSSRPSNDSKVMTTTTSSLSSIPSEGHKFETSNLDQVLDALRSPPVVPSSSNSQLLPAYLRALENAMVAASRDSHSWNRVPKVWTDILDLALSSKSKASRESSLVRAAGRDALSTIARYCIPDEAIDKAVERKLKGVSDTLSELIATLQDALDKSALRFSHARPEILSVVTALVLRLRYRPKLANGKRGEAAACQLVLQLVQTVSELRSQPKFEHREQADGVIGAAVEVCGPQTVLDELPLGLLGENGIEGGRAWLLPLMRTKITNTRLKHFVDSMIPLSGALFDRRAKAEEAGPDGKPMKPVEGKVYEALTEQVWALFPGYCDLPTDLEEALDKTFLELLANVLYSQPALRPSICRGLQLLVDRNESLARSSAPAELLQQSFGVSPVIGKKNLKMLAALAPNLLAVLFNIFSQSPSESRGYILECLVAYLRIMEQGDISNLFEKINNMLDQSLPTLRSSRDSDRGPGSVPPVPLTMMDLFTALIPFLNDAEASRLFERACTDDLLCSGDASMQKKAYRLLSRLMESKHGAKVLKTHQFGQDRVGELLTKLRESTKNVVPGAKRDRVSLLASLVPLIPASEMYHLPSIIPEAVLATKEANQGARELAYNLLVEMAHKMKDGGSIKRRLVEGAVNEDAEMDESDVVEANLNECITMVAAGLAGSSPHMISATITSLARLVYEFHTEIPTGTLKELISTLEVYLTSSNREIVKSTLGFVKIIVVSLDTKLVDQNLGSLVPALLTSSADHKQHFKAKIRHVFERLLRRFGFDRIAALTDEENRKLINNIRKRKERAKRKKASLEADDDAGETDRIAATNGPGQRALKSHGADAFEEAIYGSESDITDSDEEQENVNSTGKLSKAGKNGRRDNAGIKPLKEPRRDRRSKQEEEYIVEDDDEPMDLLDRSAAAGGRITARLPSQGSASGAGRKRKPGEEANKFALDRATGRMLIDDPEAKGALDESDGADIEGSGRAYLDRERGTHGITTRDGMVRVNKNNKRNRAEDEEMEAEQMIAEDEAAAAAAAVAASKSATPNQKKKMKPVKQRIGSEFRAKKAGGDIYKQGEQSPFAYVPLGEIGGKKKGKGLSQQATILGKDKKRRS